MKKSKFIDYQVILAVLSHRNKKEGEIISDLSQKSSGVKFSGKSPAHQAVSFVKAKDLPAAKKRA
jgi:hypothetical protein